MKNTFSRIFAVCAAVAFSLVMLTLCTVAMGNMAGGVGGAGGGGLGAGHNGRAGIDSGSGADTTMYEGNIDSGTDGMIDDNGNNDSGMMDTGSGTGEFADDTTAKNPVSDAADDIINGTKDAVDNVADAATGGMGVWGVIIAVLIIVAIIVLLFAFFSKKKR